jgi:hypothetical protein
MLKVLGTTRRACDGIPRRDLLQVGGCSLLGLSAADLFRAEAQAAPATHERAAGFGQAKACIILYLYGAPSQLETYDPKPDAPIEIRGTMGSIETKLPGLRLNENLPKLAGMVDRCTVIRSMTHPYNIHSAAYSLTGVPHVDIPMELNPYDNRHWPYIGSVLDYLESQGPDAGKQHDVPRSMGLPFQFSSRCREFGRAGPYGGFLGRSYDPIWTEFEGVASRDFPRWRGNSDTMVDDPYGGIREGGKFMLSTASQLPKDVTIDRLDSRRSLLEQFDAARRELGDTPSVQARDRFREMAFSLMGSEKMRTALDIRREKPELREAYGKNLFGQAVLAARRMIEAGSRLVTVFWDEIETANSAWDTHFDHYDRLKDELLPGLDSAFTALVADLEGRGLLDTTLVACISEHGRTPKIDDVRGAGRGHWSRAYGGLFAGGGVKRGQVIGKTDKYAGDVTERPVSPKHILSTIYHQLGVDHETMIKDRLGRPLPLVADGHIVREMLA